MPTPTPIRNHPPSPSQLRSSRSSPIRATISAPANQASRITSETLGRRAGSRPAASAGASANRNHLGVDGPVGAGLADHGDGLVLSEVGGSALHGLADPSVAQRDLDVLAGGPVVDGDAAVSG